MARNPGGIPEKAYKIELSLTTVLYIPIFEDFIEIITDFKPSFSSDNYFYEVYNLNIMENVGDRLFLWGGYHEPMNEPFTNQLLADHFPESKFKLAIDPAFDFRVWPASIGVVGEGYTVSENEKIKVFYDEDRLNIYHNTESLSYCLIPQTHFFAGQLLAHCLSGKKQVSSLSITALVAEILEL